MVFRDQRGEGKLGCLVVSLLLISLVFIGYRTIPVFLDKIGFEEELGRIASRAGADAWTNRKIEEQILEAARIRKFEVSKEDIRINRTSRFVGTPRIRFDVTFRRSVDFPGYSHLFVFQKEASTLVGRL